MPTASYLFTTWVARRRPLLHPRRRVFIAGRDALMNRAPMAIKSAQLLLLCVGWLAINRACAVNRREQHRRPFVFLMYTVYCAHYIYSFRRQMFPGGKLSSLEVQFSFQGAIAPSQSSNSSTE